MKSLLIASSAFFALCLPAQQPQPLAADVILIHGNILTGSHLSADDHGAFQERVAAIAIHQGRIIAIGKDETILTYKTSSTEVIDLHGAFAMPGFNDAHTHIASAGQQRLTVDLDNTHSLQEMLKRVHDYAAALPPNAWILGAGWDHTKWPTKTLPTRQDLDAVTGNHPALLGRTDGHIAVANTAALIAAQVTAQTPDPDGGKLDHDATGALTGIVREGPALALLRSHIPQPTSDQRRAGLKIAIQDALSHGVTSVQDFSDWDDFLVLEEMEHRHELNLRISEWLAFAQPLAVLKQRRASHPADDPLLHIGQLKAYMDGSLGSRTAALEAPYADDAANSGIPRYDQDTINQMASERAAAGFQLGFHAIGDRGNNFALNAFSAAEQAGRPAGSETAASSEPRPADFRFRIEHAQVVTPDAFDRFASLGVIASMQPSHLLTDMAWAGERLGAERSKYAYAWRSMLAHHVRLAFGTDYPVESISPFRGLYAAVTRQNEAGTQTFEPQEKLTVREALYAYTQAPAFAEFREHLKGRLEPGYLADIVVLDRDLTKASPREILETHVMRTIVNGRSVYVSGTAGPSVAKRVTSGFVTALSPQPDAD